MNIDLATLAVQTLVAVAGGPVGAWVVHKLDWQRFREEEKLREKQRKREALRRVMAAEQEMRDCLSSRGDAAVEKADKLGRMLSEVHATLFGDTQLQWALKRIALAVTSVRITEHDFGNDYEGDLEVVRRSLQSLENELSR